MKTKLVIVAVVLVGMLTCNSWATTIDLTAVADSDIREEVPDYAKGNRGGSDGHIIRNTYNNKITKAYFKFELPVDFDVATSASFEITFKNLANAAWYLDYQIFGLKDTASGNDWQDLAPGTYTGASSGGLTWNNAPANNTTEDYTNYTDDFTSDATGVLGGFTRSGGIGVTHNISAQALIDFINTDSDGVITLMMSRLNSATASSDLFYTREDASPLSPTLNLTYTPVPEPITIAIFGIGGLMAIRRKRS